MLEITTLHNGMILSTLNISSHGFAFDNTIKDEFFTYKLMIIH